MARFGGADEVVIAEVHDLRQLEEVPRHLVYEVLGRLARLVRRFFHLLAVFVGTREELHIDPVEAQEARHHITGQRRIGMTYVWRVIDVIDGRGQVIVLGIVFGAGHAVHFPCAPP